MGAIATLTSGGLRRRRMQGAIIATVLFLGTLSCTLALNVLISSSEPFEHAFASANGAHLVIDFDATVVRSDAVAASAHAAGVAESAGPWPVGRAGVLINRVNEDKGGGLAFQPITISGRPDPTTSVDRVTILQGRWWQKPGEVVLSVGEANLLGESGLHVGDTLRVQQDLGPGSGFDLPAPGATTAPGGTAPVTRTVTIVGVAGSISTTSVRAWMSPDDVAALATPSAPPALEMLYRVSPSATPADLAEAARAITAGMPDRAVASTSTWLASRTTVNSTAELMVPILFAFGAFAFLAAAFIIVNVVSGVVIGSTRQIGLLKAIGATPGQVSLILLGQILIPSVIGSALGTIVGVIGSRPILDETASALGVPTLLGPSPLVLVGVPGLALAVTIASALGPAWRAGRMRATQAITSGASPSTGRTAGLTRALLGRTALPDSVALGIGRLAARPLRTVMTLGALAVGVAAITFTFGMEGSLRQVGQAFYRDAASPVRAEYGLGPRPAGVGGPPLTPDEVTAAIAAQPGVARSVAMTEIDVAVPGLATGVPYFAYQGDASWLGYDLIDGRWFSQPGEVVVPTNFLTQTGLHVDDSMTVQVTGQPVTLHIVGSIFDNTRGTSDGPRNVIIRGSWAAIAAADPELEPSEWEIANDGSLIGPYALAQAIRQATQGSVDAFTAGSADADLGFLFFEGVVASLGLLLIVVSLGGVINTVLLEARERARQTAILRAVGMTPRQVVTMVIASVAPLGVLAGFVGIPLGLVLQQVVIADMARVSLASDLPGAVRDVLGPLDLALIVAGGLALALVGAWLPARRTSRSPIAPVLQAE